MTKIPSDSERFSERFSSSLFFILLKNNNMDARKMIKNPSVYEHIYER